MSLDYVTHTSTAHFDRLSICMSPNWCGCVSVHMFIREQTNLKHERVGAKKEADIDSSHQACAAKTQHVVNELS